MKPEERIVKRLKDIPEVERIYLFGSRARGDNAARADIDIAVSCPTANKSQWLKIWDAVEQTDTLLLIDVVRIEETSEELRRKIVSEGQVIFERS